MNDNRAPQAAAPANVGGIRRGPMLAALMIGAFISILNETLLNIAYPELMRQFGVDAGTLQWLSTGYMLVVGMLVPVSALLQQWFPTRAMFLTAMSLFLAGTAACAASPSFEWLLAGRIAQAIGTGLLLPLLMNAILILYPPERRGGAMGMIGLVVMFAPAIGPTLSGLIVDSLSWRWLFYLVLPLAAFAIAFAVKHVKNVSVPTKPRVDFVSVALSAVGFGGVVFGLSKAGEGAWSDPAVVVSLAAGALALLLFVRRQLTVPEPMLELRVFRFPLFALGMMLIALLMMMIFATMIMLPIYLQTVLLMTAFNAGLALMPGGIANGILSPLAGRLFDAIGPRALVIPGLGLVAVACWLFIGVDGATSVAGVIGIHVMLLAGFSMAMMPAQTIALNQLPVHLYPHGTAILNTLQQVAGAMGTALFVSIASAAARPDAPAAEAANGWVAGLQDAYGIAFAMAIAALVVGFWIGPRRRSSATPITEQGERGRAS